MPKLIFVIGANATGKTHFIRQRFSGKGMTCFNIYDYQQRVYREEGVGEFVPMGAQFRYLMRANQMLLADVKEALTRDEDVVVEHTLYMAKRRIAFSAQSAGSCRQAVHSSLTAVRSDGPISRNIV